MLTFVVTYVEMIERQILVNATMTLILHANMLSVAVAIGSANRSLMILIPRKESNK